tara:strand:- start:195 stop:491 length:297 start_codon:yes stop_codon:yes gene_type:complete
MTWAPLVYPFDIEGRVAENTHKAVLIITPMDLTTLDYIRILIGVAILLYVANCLVNQKVWIRKTFSWGAREEYPKIFQMNIIGGSLLGSFLVASPLLF